MAPRDKADLTERSDYGREPHCGVQTQAVLCNRDLRDFVDGRARAYEEGEMCRSEAGIVLSVGCPMRND